MRARVAPGQDRKVRARAWSRKSELHAKEKRVPTRERVRKESLSGEGEGTSKRVDEMALRRPGKSRFHSRIWSNMKWKGGPKNGKTAHKMT